MAEFVRLLTCHDCSTVQEIPWCGESPECRHPECVGPLEHRMAEHWFDPDHSHKVALGGVEKSLWEDWSARKDILSGLKTAGKPGSATGLGETFYDVKATYSDDAMMCWKKHGRTQDCGDWRSSKMKLLAPTRTERKDLGLSVRKSSRPAIFTCDFCPMASIKQTRMNSEEFGYNSPY